MCGIFTADFHLQADSGQLCGIFSADLAEKAEFGQLSGIFTTHLVETVEIQTLCGNSTARSSPATLRIALLHATKMISGYHVVIFTKNRFF